VDNQTGRSEVYLDNSGTLGDGSHAKRSDIYAHELSHVVDFNGRRWSDKAEWREAYLEEIERGQLTDYATSSPHEAFAEFGRAVASKSLAEITLNFPKCVKVWKAFGLL